jgi:hypothetical protein
MLMPDPLGLGYSACISARLFLLARSPPIPGSTSLVSNRSSGSRRVSAGITALRHSRLPSRVLVCFPASQVDGGYSKARSTLRRIPRVRANNDSGGIVHERSAN